MIASETASESGDGTLLVLVLALATFLAHVGTAGQYGIERRRFGHIAMADNLCADLARQRLNTLLERIALVGDGDVGALGAASLGNTEAKRPVVGDP